MALRICSFSIRLRLFRGGSNHSILSLIVDKLVNAGRLIHVNTLAGGLRQTSCAENIFTYGGLPMIYFGIDVSKYKHDCYIISDLGEVLNDSFSFANNAEGFGRLQKELELCGKGNARIGFEATSNYGINLKLFLERIEYDYMEINPLLIKEHIKSNTLRHTVTDKLSAKTIANYSNDKAYSPHQTAFYPKFALKQLTRLRNSLASGRSRYLIQITNVLDCVFPEFKPFFGNKFSATTL